MPLICYEQKRFSDEQLDLITTANRIIVTYQKQGFALTLRQLYYKIYPQFPDDWRYVNVGNNKWKKAPFGTKNAPPNYRALGNLISDGRMAGLVDWHAIEDRTRGSKQNVHWNRPSKILEATIGNYAADKWDNQDNYVETWVEKEALEQVLETACQPLDVRFFCCRGYTSLTAMWEASQRLLKQIEKGKTVHIIHLGDHDPSGIDMTRNIEERLEQFTYGKVHVERIALNMDQVQKNKLPPDPAKATDTRFSAYQERYGDESWELDALDPPEIVKLITDAILQYRNEEAWKIALADEKRGRHTLECIVKYFPDVIKFLRDRRAQDKSRIVCQGCGATEEFPKCTCIEKSDSRTLELT